MISDFDLETNVAYAMMDSDESEAGVCGDFLYYQRLARVAIETIREAEEADREQA